MNGQQLPSGGATGSIFIQSVPEAVKVFIDSAYQGLTPYQFKGTVLKPIVMEFRKDGYLSYIDTVLLRSLSDTTIFIRLFKPATITIASRPDSATVIVANKRVGVSQAGVTPVVLTDLPADTLQIMVSKKYHDSWSTFLIPAEGSTTNLIAKLTIRATKINVFANHSNVSVYLDDELISHGSVLDYVTSAGPHKISMCDDTTGKRINILTNLDMNSAYYSYLGMFGVRSTRRAVLATLLPGSAQLSDGAFFEGAAMAVGFIALGYNALYSHKEYNNRLDKYDTALDYYIAAPSEIEAFRRYEDVNTRKADLDKYYLRRTISLSVLVAFYIYTVVDALLNHLIVDEIEIVPLNSFPTDHRGFPLSMTPIGAQIKLKL
ncbi:MAG: PEGA domain-containing protein [Bacteroidota bacterium]